MGFFDKLFGGKAKDENTSKFTNQSKTILTPLQGKVLAQADIPDETFAQGILGPGCGIEPTGDTVYAPFDGTVTQIATTLHAVGITSSEGTELLIHVGMDTVDMKGQGFTAHRDRWRGRCEDAGRGRCCTRHSAVQGLSFHKIKRLLHSPVQQPFFRYSSAVFHGCGVLSTGWPGAARARSISRAR